MIFSIRSIFVFVLVILPTGFISGQIDSTSLPSDSTNSVQKLDTQIKTLEDEINRTYFSDAKSKNYAIACARFAEESYFYAKDIHQGYNLNRSYHRKARANADTSFYFLKRSRTMADSAIHFASDTDNIALDYMHRALKHLELQETHLYAIYNTDDVNQIKFNGTRSMFESSNALVDAYHASLYFGGGKRPDETDDEFANRRVTRLEADEAAFQQLLFLYEERIKKLEDEIELLKGLLAQAETAAQRDSMQNVIAGLNEEKALLDSKLGNARTQLDGIDTQLDAQTIAGGGDPNSKGGNDPDGFSGNVDDLNNPYLTDSDLPDGLVYRIQIGYYPISKTPKFHGVSSVHGVIDGNYIRYYTGLYDTYDEATQAKNNFRDYVIEDAFLVAFYDKRKISVYDALQKEKEIQGAGDGQE